MNSCNTNPCDNLSEFFITDALHNAMGALTFGIYSQYRGFALNREYHNCRMEVMARAFEKANASLYHALGNSNSNR